MDKKGYIKLYKQARAANKALKKFDATITESEVAYIMLLADKKLTSNKDIIAHLHGESPEGPTLVSQAVKRLLFREFITQQQDGNDRRIKHSHLTAEGKAFASDLERVLLEI